MKKYLVEIVNNKDKKIFFESEYESAEGLKRVIESNIFLGNVNSVTDINGKDKKMNENKFKSLNIYVKVL